MGVISVSPIFASESVDLSGGDYMPTKVSPHIVRVASAGILAFHYTGDEIGKQSKVQFAPPGKSFESNLHLDKVCKTGTTIPDTDIQLIGMPVRMGIQKLTGYIERAQGVKAPGATVKAMVDGYFIRESKGLEDQQILEATTDINGYFELYLMYGARALIIATGKEEVYFSAWIYVRPSENSSIFSHVIKFH